MKIALAQMSPTVGAFEKNTAEIHRLYLDAEKQGCQIMVAPELAVCGYPPHDLVERPEMFLGNEWALHRLAEITVGKKCALVVGHIARSSEKTGRMAQNSVSVLFNGKVIFHQAKTLLPTYDVFDEARYFEPAREIKLWEFQGERIALAICEDLWAKSLSRPLYASDPVDQYQAQGASLVLSLSASPYEWEKQKLRESLLQDVAQHLKAPVLYVNQVGATDEILFDGQSLAVNAQGQVLARMPAFQSCLAVIDVRDGKISGADRVELQPEIQTLHLGLVAGIREYFARTGFKKAILGLSGGIDSAVVAGLAAQALGAENVRGVAMPSQFSSSHSLEDAEQLARGLGIRFEVQPIKFVNSALSRQLCETRGVLAPVAQENMQARLRGIILMTLANHENALVFATSNKSELATGYSTQYGDLLGALAPIGDVTKMRVYELGREINRVLGSVIPAHTFEKPPSAELRPGQKDEDSLPPYPLLDRFVQAYIEDQLSVVEIQALSELKGVSWVEEMIRKVEINEYKRRQSPLILKVTKKAFGIGRRVPVAKTWLQVPCSSGH